MNLFYPYQYSWGCESCGAQLLLFVSENEGGVGIKWIKSLGIRWNREMKVGDNLVSRVQEDEGMACAIFECSSCLTEYTFNDLKVLAKRERRPSGDKTNEQ